MHNQDTNNPKSTTNKSTHYAEIFRPFRDDQRKVLREPREHLDYLKENSQARLKVQKGILDFARCELQVAKMFQADKHVGSTESTRHWANESATRSLRLICWCIAGHPAHAGAPRASYEAFVHLLGYPLPETAFMDLSCSTKEGAQFCINTARDLMELAKAEMYRTTGEG